MKPTELDDGFWDIPFEDNARAAKKEAMHRSDEHAAPEWKTLMLELVHLACLERASFTTDEPMNRYAALPNPKPATHDTRAMGPVMVMAAKRGWCRKTNRVEDSVRASCHNRPLAIWESLLFEKKAAG